MNPEIRFRVSPEIHQLAEQRAQQLGLSGLEAGRSAGVPLLARAALYQWLGLPWPDDLPRPLRPPQQSLAPAAKCAQLTVHHSLSETYRRQSLDQDGIALASATTTILELNPAKITRELRRCLRLDAEGRLSGVLQLPELESDGPITTAQLEQFLGRPKPESRSTLDQQEWQQTLADWSQTHGSKLLRARQSEGFAWQALAESEWIHWQVQRVIGQSIELEELRAEQSLAGEPWVHSLYPDREPSLERIELLRALRAKSQELGGLRVTLVRGTRDQIESRKRSSGSRFSAVLWQLETPSGNQLGLVSHIA
jgi:hypothetical protein